ncbi:MAG: ankyrin repeat domain-containing protein [Thiovulaceae bacterium]|nr:ankyrin repeat domain-containing protein [Sulfurimonadaceae bacterium]
MANNIFETLEDIIYKSDLESFKSTVDNLENINIQHEKYGWTLLHMAIRRDEREMVKYLLDKGADINKVDGVGWTPLMEAIMDDMPELCKTLVDAGADKTIVNKRGVTAPMLAQKFGRENMYDYLS